LAAYLQLTGITSGFLFPNHSTLASLLLKDPITEINEEHRVKYAAYNDTFVKLCKRLIVRKDKFGTHTCRKTGYMEAGWGGGEEMDLMAAARHRSASSALLYKQDSATLYHIAKLNNPEMICYKWKPIYIKQYQLSRSANANGIDGRTPMQKLQRFTSKECGIAKTHPNYSVLHVIQTVLAFRKRATPMSELQQIFSDLGLGDEAKAKIIRSVEAYAMSYREENATIQCVFIVYICLHKVVPVASTGVVLPTLAIQSIVTAANGSTDQPPTLPSPLIQHQPIIAPLIANPLNPFSFSTIQEPKKKRGGSNDLVERMNVKKVKGEHKLELLIRLKESLPQDLNELTENARSFVQSSLNPVMLCYTSHYSSDKNLFMAKWLDDKQDLKHAAFKKRCCSGGAVCGLNV